MVMAESAYSTYYPLVLGIGNIYSITLSQNVWNTILNWSGSELEITIVAAQQGYPETGPYYSETFVVDIPQYVTSSIDETCVEITGVLNDLDGLVQIPEMVCGKYVTKIADYALAGQTQITGLSIPDTVFEIGEHSFDGCTSLTSVSLPNTITEIPDYAFNNCPLSAISYDVCNITSIGSHAFYGNNFIDFYISNNTTYVGESALVGANSLVIYCGSIITIALWNASWNSANSPCLYGCSFGYSDGKAYLISFVKMANNPLNNPANGIHNPSRSGYTFEGLFDNSSCTGTMYVYNPNASNSITTLANGTTIYVKWRIKATACVTAGTLVTLADGTQVAVETLTGNEELLVWDMLNGTYSSAPILFVDSEEETTYDVITLTFSDGTQVEVIDEHAFFDLTLNEYVFLRSDAAQYIGHSFHKQADNNTWVAVQLTNVEISQKVTTAWSPVTYGHLCYYVNGMLSMPGNTESFINIFDVDPTTMSYDLVAMAQDIATYGLYTYEEFNNIIPIPQLVFDAFNGQYLKVAIGKGITSLEEICNLLNRYMSFFE